MFGTGGQILAMFKQVMGVFAMLHTLELRDLLLDGCEGMTLLDDVSERSNIHFSLLIFMFEGYCFKATKKAKK